jgi:tRNA A-37 threonylcarbamoyl transferase component Bud32
MTELDKHGVIHHDLKPNNVLLDENVDPKITDVGLWQIMTEGVPEILSGERVYGLPVDVDLLS